MKVFVIIPVVIALAAASAVAICRMLSVDPHLRELLFAAGACGIAAELAMVPIILTRGAAQLAVVQAALVGTIIHLFGSAVLGGLLLMMKTLRLGPSLLYWLLAFYWLTLIVVVTALVRAIRAAPVAK